MVRKGFAPLIIAAIIAAVAIAGAVGYFSWKKIAVPVMQPTVILRGTVMQSTSAVVNWKTYKSPKNSYQFQYPTGFNVLVNQYGYGVDISKIGDKSNFDLHFSDLAMRGNLSWSEFIHNDTSYDTYGNDLKNNYTEESTGTINGITYYQYLKILGSSNQYNYFLERDQNSGIYAGYTHESALSDSLSANPYEKIFNQIISTFQFIQK